MPPKPEADLNPLSLLPQVLEFKASGILNGDAQVIRKLLVMMINVTSESGEYDVYSDPWIIGNASERDRAFYPFPVQEHFNLWSWLPNVFPQDRPFSAVELGSRSVCAQSPLKTHMQTLYPRGKYLGIDIHPGDGVDLVSDIHCISNVLAGESQDLVYSGAVFEHLAMPWVAAEEISKVLKPGGYAVIFTHFSFSEHEMPWHFFQFNHKALEVLFCKKLGFELIDSGKAMPMIGRFAFDAPPSHAGQPIGNLYCSSWIVARKSLDFVPDIDKYGNFDWRKALPSVIGDTIYPPNTGLSS